MKVLEFHGMKDEDSLWFSFKGDIPPRMPLEAALDPLLRELENSANDWMPDVVEGKRQRKYSRAAVGKALEEQRHDRGATLGFYRTTWPPLDMTLRVWLPPLHPELEVTIKLKPLSFFAEVERCHSFVQMTRVWASHYPVTHALAHGGDDAEESGFPDFGREERTARRDGFDQLYELFWLNVLGPKLVDSLGRERVLSTPAHRVEALPNGSVLLVLWPTPADFARDAAREVQARAHVHLRPDLDYSTVLGALRERSAALAPVEPDFPQGLAPLLSRLVDATPSHQRSRTISRLNAWRPPEPQEWRPAHAALPVDVPDEEAARAHYRSLAEHLVALLHSDVPSVFHASPESLTDIDFYFWREDFPSTRLPDAIERLAVPALGAYLGEVLVRHLGGTWLPRQALLESQVLVGERVWLPFLRAHHALRSRQSLLDSSLSGLFLAATRHRS